jgi:hypothetical protein
LQPEAADWATSNPRLSLLQVRTATGPNYVIDVLEPQMTQMRRVLDEEFIPQVMANETVEKWAHYARYERRFLGQDRVVNLNCTFEMARRLPYYRLPLRGAKLPHPYIVDLCGFLRQTRCEIAAAETAIYATRLAVPIIAALSGCVSF